MRSDNVTKGPERAPNRSLFYALGYTPEELERPLIGVVSAYSEIVPGHMNLDKLADAVKAGVRMAGGTPILIPAIGVCDGIAMGHIGMKYSLASRELICDSVETMFMAHQLDGLVLVPQLRQDRARHADGRLPAGRARHRLLRRSHAGRQLRRRGSQPVQNVRGRGRLQGGPDRRCTAGGLHLQLLPRLRLLQRHVHRQQHELPVRGHRHRAARQRHHPRRLRQAAAAGQAVRHGCHGPGAPGRHRTADRQRAVPSATP